MKNSWAARISIVLMLSCACSQKPAQNPETEALDKLAGDFWTCRAEPGDSHTDRQYSGDFAAGRSESHKSARAVCHGRDPSPGKYSAAPARNGDRLAGFDNS